jgi:hypothetical protein
MVFAFFFENFLILVISSTFMRKLLPFYVQSKYMHDFLAKHREKQIEILMSILVQLMRAPIVSGMDEGTIKTPNPKCRLY